MRAILTICIIFLIGSFAAGQNTDIKWYSESTSEGVTIQNSFPKGGLYTGPISKHHNYSYLVFVTRIINHTEKTLDICVNFSSDSISIPNSPNTYVKLFLPSDTMTADKGATFSYGIMKLESLNNPTKLERKIGANEDCYFYVVALFYQTNADAWNEERGGNRAELLVKGQELFYRMMPQIESLLCGRLVFIN